MTRKWESFKKWRNRLSTRSAEPAKIIAVLCLALASFSLWNACYRLGVSSSLPFFVFGLAVIQMILVLKSSDHSRFKLLSDVILQLSGLVLIALSWTSTERYGVTFSFSVLGVVLILIGRFAAKGSRTQLLRDK